MIKKIKADYYLKKFVDFCRQRYGENLIGIGIYGSYAWGYFDNEKSDYDVFLIFNKDTKDETEKLMSQFKKITVQYFCSKKKLLNLIHEGHWSLYVTFLTGARMLYYSKDYKIFIGRLKKMDFVKNLKDIKRIEWKSRFDEKCIKKSKGYDGAKYAFPALRSRLQLLTYIKYKRLIWDLAKNIRLNREILTSKEQRYLIQLDKSVRNRENIFSNKKMALTILHKINKNVISRLS